MKQLELSVTGETQRDLYNALRQVTDMVDEDFKAATGEAPCFTFTFTIFEKIELIPDDGDVVNA